MFERLIKLVREEKVSLFIGAGFSLKAGAPSARALCDAILSEFDNAKQREEYKDAWLADIANFYVEEVCSGSRNSLIELLQKQFSFEPTNLEDHQALAKIPHFHNIFTTNYDTLLESSYDKQDCQVIRKDADCTYIDETKPVRVFKIHGDFANQDFVIITSKDYQDYFKHNHTPQMWNVVKHEFLTKHILFIGYSLSDDNIINIIKHISKSVNKNQKDMFLIAPGINKSKQTQLKKMKVQYFDSVASDFFAELTKELDANIGMDFRHHKVPADTFSRYCNLHGFNPDIALKSKDDNDIVDFKPLPGNSLTQNLNFTIKGEMKDIIEEHDFETNGIIVKNMPFPNVPAIKIEGDNLIKCSYAINGVVVQNEISQILLFPVVEETEFNIRIPSRDFMEKIKAKKYNPKKGKAVYELDCHIYTLKISVELKEYSEKGAYFTYNFNYDFRDTYTDNSAAIKWIDLIAAFFSGEEVEMTAEAFPRINTKEIDSFKKEHNFDNYKKYYQNIKRIELLTKQSFTEYYDCTEERYRISNTIMAFLTHQPITVHGKEPVKFSVEVNEQTDFAQNAKNEKNISIVSTEVGGKSYTLNGRTFPIPYTHTIFNSCSVTGIKKKRKKVKVDFESLDKDYSILLSEKSADEEFPSMKFLDVTS